MDSLGTYLSSILMIGSSGGDDRFDEGFESGVDENREE